MINIWELSWNYYYEGDSVVMMKIFDVGDTRWWRTWISWSWYYYQPTPNWFCSISSFYWFNYHVVFFVIYSPSVLCSSYPFEIEQGNLWWYIDESIIIAMKTLGNEDFNDTRWRWLLDDADHHRMILMMMKIRRYWRDYTTLLINFPTHISSPSFFFLRLFSFLRNFK